jgi:hypothetical protein
MSEKKAKEERRNWECKQCGTCCHTMIGLTIENMCFIPLEPHTVTMYRHPFVCSNFNRETKLCKDYENRPDPCRKYNCHGKQTPQVIDIVGTKAGGQDGVHEGQHTTEQDNQTVSQQV